MNIILSYLIIGVGRRLILQIISKPEYVKLGYDEFDTVTNGTVDDRNQDIAEFAIYSWKSIIFHVIAWPIVVIADIGMSIYYLYHIFKKS